jgi:hypothetical protein
MKWLIILGILLLVAAYLVVRFRKQIQTGIYLIRMFRQMNRAATSQGAQKGELNREPVGHGGDVELVRCAGCGSWTPRSTAVKLSKGNFYCKSACMELAVGR